MQLLRLCKDFSAELKAEEGVVRLSIRRVYPEDEGEYTCVAYNELGSDSTSACLIVDGTFPFAFLAVRQSNNEQQQKNKTKMASICNHVMNVVDARGHRFESIQLFLI